MRSLSNANGHKCQFMDRMSRKDKMQALRHSLSDPRLASYLRCAGDRMPDAMQLYLADMHKATRLWPLIHAVEVTLRNRTHKALSRLWGPDWLLRGAPQLMPEEQQRVQKAMQRLPRSRRRSPTEDNLIANLSLGFWVTMYDTRYDSAPHHLWRKGLHQLFPGKSHKNVRKRLERIRYIRNRIAHHENLLKYDEARIRTTCHDILSWMYPETDRWARLASALAMPPLPPQSS